MSQTVNVFHCYIFAGSWEREKTQHARRCHDKSVNEKEDETMDEEDREVEGTDSPEPHEVMVAREEINMLLAEQRKTAALKVRLSISR